jgi:hypothetical protein
MYPSNIGQLLQVCSAALRCVFGAYIWYQFFVVQCACTANEIHLDSVFVLLLHNVFSYMFRFSLSLSLFYVQVTVHRNKFL